MAEDYTYTTVTDWRKRAHELAGNVIGLESAAKKQRQQVQELEHQLAQADSNMVALAARNAELAARLAELEPSGFAMANSALIQRVRRLERENAELRARLDAAWEYAQYYRATMYDIEYDDWRGEVLDINEWMADGKPLSGMTQKTKRDWREQQDTDAPLKLAELDEDGDE